MSDALRRGRALLLMTAALCSTAVFAAFPAAGQDSFLIAGTGQELSEELALQLVRDGRYKMTQIREDEGLLTLLYTEAGDLSDYMPPHVVAAMARMDAGIDPAARWFGRAMPRFSLTDLEGLQVSSDDLLGKVVVLNFWFRACSPCIREMPVLSELEQSHRDNPAVVFLAISFDPPDVIRALLKETEFSYRQLTAPSEWFVEAGIDTYPTHLVVGGDGIIRNAIAGLEDPEILTSELDGMIHEALSDLGR